jgi:L-aspartate oxidase
VATGDGMAAAYRAGAELRDMEFMQFHPTILYVAGSSRYLISEAVRGEGAYLRDKDGVRFMPEEDPRAELATRDVVARAIVRRMEQTQHPNVYLDLSHLDADKVRAHFPGIDKVCREFGLDITHDLIPVRPGAHYMVGGVTVDINGRTTLPSLWAAGEVSSSGLHGANRLASNSLLEGLVFGAACGRGATEAAARMPDAFVVPPVQGGFTPDNGGPPLDTADLTNALRSLMVRNMGIVRDRGRLLEAEKQVAFWCRYVLRREFSSRSGWELQNLLTVARLMIWSALQRTESRGVHYRADFPNRDDEHWVKHVVCPPRLADPPGKRG